MATNKTIITIEPYNIPPKPDYPNYQFLDIEITKRKFEKEVRDFVADASNNERRGILLSRTEFPLVRLDFQMTYGQKSKICFSAIIDFSNYDFCPLSVRLVKPGTNRQMSRNQWISYFLGKNCPEIPQFSGIKIQNVHEPLYIAMGYQNRVSFFCYRGIREYHNHPGHSGDFWFIYRGSGVGSLKDIVRQLFYNGTRIVQRIHAK